MLCCTSKSAICFVSENKTHLPCLVFMFCNVFALWPFLSTLCLNQPHPPNLSCVSASHMRPRVEVSMVIVSTHIDKGLGYQGGDQTVGCIPATPATMEIAEALRTVYTSTPGLWRKALDQPWINIYLLPSHNFSNKIHAACLQPLKGWWQILLSLCSKLPSLFSSIASEARKSLQKSSPNTIGISHVVNPIVVL